MLKNKKGFTLVELLATIVVIGIIVGIAVPVYLTITKNVEQKTYDSKKATIEAAAEKFASENNISSTYQFTVTELVLKGYYAADKYDTTNYRNINGVVVTNPLDKNGNLACRVINLSINNNEYTANMSDDVDNCELSETEYDDSKIEVKAYRIDSNNNISFLDTEDGSIGINESKELNWVNKDVLLVVSSTEYTYDKIDYTMSGNAESPTGGTLKDIKDYKSDTTYMNVYKISAKVFLSTDLTITLNTTVGTKNKTVKVRIDKEPATLSFDLSNAWMGTNKETTIFGSDGSGSGIDKVYYISNDVTIAGTLKSDNNVFLTAVNDANTNGNTDPTKGLVVSSFEQGINKATANLTNMDSGTYDLWTLDKAGNYTSYNKPITMVIKNVDNNPPIITIPNNGIHSNTLESGYNYYNTYSVDFNVVDYESGMKYFKTCIDTSGNCTPTTEATSTTSNYNIAFTEAKRDYQTLCYTAEDNVGNHTQKTENGNTALKSNPGVICQQPILFDNTGIVNDGFNFNKNKFELELKYHDYESGIKDLYIEIKDGSNIVYSDSINIGDGYGSSYNIELSDLPYNKNYTFEVSGTNHAHIDFHATGSFINSFTIADAYNLCNASDNFCNNQIFLKYGNTKLILYHQMTSNYQTSTGSNNNKVITDNNITSDLAVDVGSDNMASLIDDTCCDHGKCHIQYVKSEAVSGIYSSGSKTGYSVLKKYNELPSNRTSTLLYNYFEIDKINSTDFSKSGEYVTETRAKLQFTEESLNSAVPDIIYQGYSYYLPTFDDSSITCYVDSTKVTESNGKLLQPTSSPLNYSLGNHTLTCKKANNTDISKIITIQASPDDETLDDSYVNITTSTYNTSSSLPYTIYNPDYVNKTNYINIKSTNSALKNFGLMTYHEYAVSNSRNLFSNVKFSTLLSTVVGGVVYKKTDYPLVWSNAYGHDGTLSEMSAIYANNGVYYALTPIRWGRAYAQIVLSFNPQALISSGNGKKDNPFIVDENWWG